jgi:hypothetical protein
MSPHIALTPLHTRATRAARVERILRCNHRANVALIAKCSLGVGASANGALKGAVALNHVSAYIPNACAGSARTRVLLSAIRA